MMTYRQKLSIKRNAVIVIIPVGEVGIQFFRLTTLDRNFVKKSIHVEQQLLSIRHPIGGFKPARSFVNYFSFSFKDIHGFEAASQKTLFVRIIFFAYGMVNTHIPSRCLFGNICVV